MALGQSLILFLRVVCLGIGLAAFVMQLEPSRNFKAATIVFDGIGYADYRAIYLTDGGASYPILYADERVYRYLFSNIKGGSVDVVLRPGNGIVEMRSGEDLIFSVDDYARAWDRSKSAARKWMFGALVVFFGTFLVRRSLL